MIPERTPNNSCFSEKSVAKAKHEFPFFSNQTNRNPLWHQGVIRWCSLADWESRSYRNDQAIMGEQALSLADWESRSYRNEHYARKELATSLADWESRSYRNSHVQVC